MMIKPIKICCSAVLVSFLVSAHAFAACTYNEAIMAFENGNSIRGQALMKMAARDGDNRAVHYLASKGIDKGMASQQALSQQALSQKELSQQEFGNTQSEKLVVMDTSKSASDIN